MFPQRPERAALSVWWAVAGDSVERGGLIGAVPIHPGGPSRIPNHPDWLQNTVSLSWSSFILSWGSAQRTQALGRKIPSTPLTIQPVNPHSLPSFTVVTRQWHLTHPVLRGRLAATWFLGDHSLVLPPHHWPSFSGLLVAFPSPPES